MISNRVQHEYRERRPQVSEHRTRGHGRKSRPCQDVRMSKSASSIVDRGVKDKVSRGTARFDRPPHHIWLARAGPTFFSRRRGINESSRGDVGPGRGGGCEAPTYTYHQHATSHAQRGSELVKPAEGQVHQICAYALYGACAPKELSIPGISVRVKLLMRGFHGHTQEVLLRVPVQEPSREDHHSANARDTE